MDVFCKRQQKCIYYFACLFAYFVSPVLSDDPIVTIIETNPVVDAVEKKIIAEKNKDVQITCTVENRPKNYEVQWVADVIRNGTITPVPISTSTQSYDPFKFTIDLPSPTSLRLRIQNVQVTDEGVYTCKVQVSNRNYVQASEELIIVEKPRIADLETSSDISKSEGEGLTLKCHATGRPKPLVKWTRMAGELLPSGGRQYLKSVLVFPFLKPDHSGTYKCTAWNSAGKDSRDIQVDINYAPRLASANTVVRQAVGYVKQLVCDVRGYPTPQGEDITWTKRGSSSGLAPHISIRNIPGASSHITSILEFWGVREGDYGEYSCAAKNEKGFANSLKFQLQKSSQPTPDRTNTIRAGASVLALNVGTVVMLLTVCLLQRMQIR